VFDVYERRQLDNVLREQEPALSDLADQDEVIEIGKLTGAIIKAGMRYSF